MDRADPWWRLDADIDWGWRFPFFGLSALSSKTFWPGKGFLNQSRNWAVESTWSSCLPLSPSTSGSFAECSVLYFC